MIQFLKRIILFLPAIIKIISVLIDTFEENEKNNKSVGVATKPSPKTD
jgi:hypothetical protein